MVNQLTQWTVVRSRDATGDTDDALGVIRLRSPAGDVRPYALAAVSEGVRLELRRYAGGSKLPADVVETILAAQAAPPPAWPQQRATR